MEQERVEYGKVPPPGHQDGKHSNADQPALVFILYIHAPEQEQEADDGAQVHGPGSIRLLPPIGTERSKKLVRFPRGQVLALERVFQAAIFTKVLGGPAVGIGDQEGIGFRFSITPLESVIQG